jgi:hypothetical protein
MLQLNNGAFHWLNRLIEIVLLNMFLIFISEENKSCFTIWGWNDQQVKIWWLAWLFNVQGNV